MNKNKQIEFDSIPKLVRDHINQLERIRSDFVANVSHELRTPLTVIRGYLETLLQNNQDEKIDTISYQQIFNQMHEYSIRMENIINDLLLLSRLENEDQPLEEKQNNIQYMLEAICLDAERISGNKNHIIQLQADPDLFLNGAEKELKSLFSNIIINAVKYTPPKGKITIKWYCFEENAIFSVMDTGIGIATEHIPRITERFYRADKARSRENGGTGLGLAIAKHVLMRHQGRLIIDSCLGMGSVFSCYFPKSRTTVMKLSQ